MLTLHTDVTWLLTKIDFPPTGAVRLVETKYLRRDPQDERERPSSANRSRGKPTMRIYTPRNRGTSRGAW